MLWIYAPALNSYLVTDDFQWVQGGLQFRPSSLFEFAGRTHFFRPVVELYFGAMQAGFACSAWALHAASIFVHLLNAALLVVVTWRLTSSGQLAALAGLLFAVQSAPAEAVTWPSAISTLLCGTFGLTMLALDLGPAPSGVERAAGRSLSVAAACAAAVGSHESGVVFLPIALLLRVGRGERRPLPAWIREYAPGAAVVAGYLVITAWINSRNYVVTEGHYRLGDHAIRNFLDYLVMLYAGHRVVSEYVLVACACVAMLWKGSPRIRSLCLWMLIALIPVLPFTWGTSSRYAYLASMPFACLIAAGLIWLKDAALRRVPSARFVPFVAALAAATMAFVAVRSAVFARKGALTFASGAAQHEAAARAIRRAATGPTLIVRRSDVAALDPLYVVPLARTAACDPLAAVELQDR